MKQEYLMLAHTFAPKKQHLPGWLVSDKLDGERCFWDGGISRGLAASEVPYANTVKDGRLVEKPIATGLWTRSGKVVHAPDFWLDRLPQILLDGELYCGPHSFQRLRKIVGCHTPNLTDWQNVEYHVFDNPQYETMFKPREIKIRNDYVFNVQEQALSWVRTRRSVVRFNYNGIYALRYQSLKCFIGSHPVIRVIEQRQLPSGSIENSLQSCLNEALARGAEGLMLRHPGSTWETVRSHHLLKHKPWHDAEGTLIGFTAGKGKYVGKIGALIIDYNGKRLELSGMTDAERELMGPYSIPPGADLPATATSFSQRFYPNQLITFKYRELSDDGVPKEARYWRPR